MPPFTNLVSESLLVNATIDFLESKGGRATAVSVVDRVMRIRKPEPDIARLLMKDLIERDSRLELIDDIVEFIGRDHDRLQLANTDFVVFDLETTGAKSPPCRVTEIGAYRVKNGSITDEFNTLVNPETPIPPFIRSLTGINDAMVRNAPKFGEIAADLLDFIGDSVLVAHNARFDMGFLNYEIGRVYEDYRLENPSLCTVQLSRKLLPHIENHKLNTVARYFSIKLENHHRAGDDARATAGIFLNLLDDLRIRGIHDLEAARKFGSRKNYVRRRKTAA